MEADAVPVAIAPAVASLRVHSLSVFVRLPLMTKWEYATVPLLVHATKQILDNWGGDGWELVAIVPGPNSEQLVAYMKRPVE